MTPKKKSDPDDEQSRGVLDDAASLDTAGIGILGGTAQVTVSLPTADEDDLVDDEVVDGEVVDLVIDDEREPDAAPEEEPSAVEEPATLGSSIVIEIDEPAVPADDGSAADADAEAARAQVDADAPLASAEDTAPGAPEDAAPAATDDAAPAAEEVSTPSAAEEDEVPSVDRVVAAEAEATSVPAGAPADVVAAEAAAAAAFIARAGADLEAKASALTPTPSRPPRSAAAPASARPSASDRTPGAARTDASTTKGHTVNDTAPKAVAPQARPARGEVALTSKRLDDLGDSSRESADLLTADRLLDPSQVTKPEPEGAWSQFLYTISGRRINIGDGRRARERKALTARIAAPLSGSARFVPVLSRKGGVGKTTITALLGMALADAREDRVIAVDANPDRGTLADRVARPHHNKSVRDLVRIHGDVRGYHDISAIVARDATRLDVLASDADPHIAEAFSDSDYRDVADVAAHYYSLVLTDTGTGIVHSVMSATLDLADQIVIVSGLSVDEARLASETLTWLETNGYAEQAREAIVVLNQSTPGAPLVRLNELEAHFATRTKKVVRVPYDPQIAGGGTIVFANLQPETRVAARELAALLVEGLRAKAA
ncbi:MinD/ParA family ATP-binding protein [Microbacterium sp. XT11]|uniref:MinD/ParA family ATP-binding protein n=1 Tax=Microbacterium sp. XT11 TaxID=367477 RepID=UPI000835FC6B|nr:MinD/ParA family protein [Microbacterium sp. XT11]